MHKYSLSLSLSLAHTRTHARAHKHTHTHTQHASPLSHNEYMRRKARDEARDPGYKNSQKSAR